MLIIILARETADFSHEPVNFVLLIFAKEGVDDGARLQFSGSPLYQV